MADLFPKRCKVYPRNGLQFIPGILEKQKRIEFPAELPLSETELRRCLSFADVYEVTDGGDVLVTLLNYLSDNSKATPAKDVPEVELQYPRDEKDEDEGEEEEDAAQSSAASAASAAKVQAKTASYQNNKHQQKTNTAQQQKSAAAAQQQSVNVKAAKEETTTETK